MIENILFYLFAFSVCIIIFLSGLFIGKLNEKLKHKKKLKYERQDAIKRSRSVLTGQFAEQIAPFLPNFPANPSEIHFIGKPVDYIAFKGSSTGKISEVIFIEVKSGKSVLTSIEKSLKEAIEKGNVKYKEYYINNL